MTKAFALASRFVRGIALAALAAGLFVLPTLPAQAQNSQANAPDRCFAKIRDKGLQWDPVNAGATVWQDPNIRHLCLSTPAVDYPIDCFSAGIRQGMQWPEALATCSFNASGCAYQSALQYGVSFAADGSYQGVSSRAWDSIIRHCNFGEALNLFVDSDTTNQAPGPMLGVCSMMFDKTTGVFNNGLTQNDIVRMCSESQFTQSPHVCIYEAQEILLAASRLQDPQGNVFAAATAMDWQRVFMKEQVVNLCANSLSSVTTDCLKSGLAQGRDLETVVDVCRAKEENFGRFPIDNSMAGKGLSTVQAMGYNCVTANAVDNQGNVDMDRGWRACANQPLFY